ncbi:MAG: hypothetical protein ACREM2_02915 [Vulcanimicrobiaceae bacterium]
MRIRAGVRRAILEPAEGSALARARDFGIDLSSILESVARTSQERVERMIALDRMRRTIDAMREDLRPRS